MNFDIGKIFFRLINPEFLPKKPIFGEQNEISEFSTEIGTELTKTKPEKTTVQNTGDVTNFSTVHSMNKFANQDRSVYIKNILGLPQKLGDILQNVQNPNKPLTANLGLGNLNPNLIQNPKPLSEIFSELNPVVQNTQEIVNILNTQAQTVQLPQPAANQDAVALVFSGMVSLPEISKLILEHSKQAVAGLVIAMASASKHGMDSKQIQETLSVVNSCIAMAESDNPAQNLKSLMMLYLPWLPLNEDIGFDLEITTPDGENESSNSKLTVMIQTKNYGNLKGLFTLTTSNSVDIYITCSDKFPKNTLIKSLTEESSSYVMNTNIDIEEIKPIEEDLKEQRETKVNLSATNEMNPYLLLMAHSFIRNTIIIDNGGTLNQESDKNAEL